MTVHSILQSLPRYYFKGLNCTVHSISTQKSQEEIEFTNTKQQLRAHCPDIYCDTNSKFNFQLRLEQPSKLLVHTSHIFCSFEFFQLRIPELFFIWVYNKSVALERKKISFICYQQYITIRFLKKMYFVSKVVLTCYEKEVFYCRD